MYYAKQILSYIYTYFPTYNILAHSNRPSIFVNTYLLLNTTLMSEVKNIPNISCWYLDMFNNTKHFGQFIITIIWHFILYYTNYT